MSPRILRALMQLFALFSSSTGFKLNERKTFVTSFLEEEIIKDQVDEYIQIYEQFVAQYIKRKTKSSPQKEISVNSVKILTICSLLNEELTQQQKIIVLIKLLELLRLEGDLTSLSYEFVSTVADSFKIPFSEFTALKNYIFVGKENFNDLNRLLVITSKRGENKNINYHIVEGLRGEIYILYIKIQNMLVFYIDSEKEVYLNQRLLMQFRIYILSYGSALRIPGITPIYYSDIISTFNSDKIKTKIVFEVDKIFYKFRNNKVGIYPLSITERSGRLVGVMGASGSGKSTLVNILNGNFSPTSGHVYINGVDLHQNTEALKGLIGYVSQDDLLIEELTVFENLFYNAKLCLASDSDFTIKRKVLKLMKELGLFDIKDMKVGSVLDRKISGGQRKRLNISLELLREPPILFLDEPTSGLSSRDSENIMDLLKDLTLNGKLVFVVIHQPSSTIFKMFDRLVVLDQGGFMIYNGKPIEAILFFKSAIREADWSDTVCQTCGNVNPEQIFNIIETRILDEYGNQTQTRKFNPEDWYDRFHKYEEQAGKKRSYLVRKIPEIQFKVPSKFKQMKVFVERDILSKFSNLQYLLINLIETPLMALALSYIIKYWSLENSEGYKLFYNENLPVYIFMSVIIAIFVGLSVSAEEIYKDRKILRRESFLNLSRFSYLTSKLAILLMISAYQSFIYVVIGNNIIEINFFLFEYWLVLFSVWFSSNVLGLVISETFESSATIYILIPFLVIPQIILSGVLVPYNKLNPNISNPNSIPWYGEIITARWGYEALVVKQYKDNPYMRNFYDYEKIISESDYIKQYWCKSMHNKIDDFARYQNFDDKKQRCDDDLKLLRNEFNTKHPWLKRVPIDFNANNLYYEKVTPKLLDSVSDYLEKLRQFYNEIANTVNNQKDDFINQLNQDTSDGMTVFDKKMKYHNEKLETFVQGGNMYEQALEFKNRLYRTYKPIFNTPEQYFFKADFYSPTKPLFGKQVDTFYFNIVVIWLISFFFFVLLYYKSLRKLINFVEYLNMASKHKKESKTQKEYIGKKKKSKNIFVKFLNRFSN